MSLQPLIEGILKDLEVTAPTTPHPFCIAVDKAFLINKIRFKELTQQFEVVETGSRQAKALQDKEIRNILKDLKNLRYMGRACIGVVGEAPPGVPPTIPPEELIPGVPPVAPPKVVPPEEREKAQQAVLALGLSFFREEGPYANYMIGPAETAIEKGVAEGKETIGAVLSQTIDKQTQDQLWQGIIRTADDQLEILPEEQVGMPPPLIPVITVPPTVPPPVVPVVPPIPFKIYTKEELDRMRLRSGTPNLAAICKELTAKGIPCHVSRTKPGTIYSILEAYDSLKAVEEVPEEKPTPPPVKPKPTLKVVTPFPLRLDLPIFQEAVQPKLLEDKVVPRVLDEYVKAGAITWADVINPSPAILIAMTRTPEGKKIKFKETGTQVYNALVAIASQLPPATFPTKEAAKKALAKVNALPFEKIDLPRLGKKGSKTRQKLAGLGVETLGDLITLTDEKIMSQYPTMPQLGLYQSFREKAKGLQAELLARERAKVD